MAPPVAWGQCVARKPANWPRKRRRLQQDQLGPSPAAIGVRGRRARVGGTS